MDSFFSTEELKDIGFRACGNEVMISRKCSIYIADFCFVSVGGFVYAATDYYSGAAMTNPSVPEQYRPIREAPVDHSCPKGRRAA